MTDATFFISNHFRSSDEAGVSQNRDETDSFANSKLYCNPSFPLMWP